MKVKYVHFLTLFLAFTLVSCALPVLENGREDTAAIEESKPESQINLETESELNGETEHDNQVQQEDIPKHDNELQHEDAPELDNPLQAEEPEHENAPGSSYEGLLFPYLIGDGWGYIDSEGNTVIEGNYWGLGEFQGDYVVAPVGMRTVTLLDRTGKRVLAELEDKMEQVKYIEIINDTALVNLNTIVGLPGGEVLYDYNDAIKFIPWHKEGFYKIRKDGLSGYMNIYGEVIVDLMYKLVGEFRNGVALVETTEGKIRMIDTDGKTVMDDFILDLDEYEYYIEEAKGDYIFVCDTDTSYKGIYQVGVGMILLPEYVNLEVMPNGQIVAANKQYKYSLFSPDCKELTGGYDNITECGKGWYIAIDQSQKVKLVNQYGEEIYEFRGFRFPNNVYWDGGNTFFYQPGDKTIIVIDSTGKELTSITSPYNSEGPANYKFINGLIQMTDSEPVNAPTGDFTLRAHCDYFRYNGEKVDFCKEDKNVSN